MTREKGKIKVSNKLGGKVKWGKKELPIPKVYDLSPRERFNGKECEFDFDGVSITKIYVDGQELPKDTEAEKLKAEREKRRQEEKEQARLAEEAEKKYAALNAKYREDSFDIRKSFCPKDTMDLNIQPFQVENFALKLNRFARFEENEGNYSKSKFEFYKTNRGNIEHQIIPNFEAIDFDAITERAKRNATLFLGEQTAIFNKSTASRLITGLGGASVYETDIALHHIYGFPYLPATGIKGVVRSWIIQMVFAAKEHTPEKEREHPLVNAECRAYQNELFCRIFGCPATYKKVLFDEKGKPIKNGKKYKTTTIEVALKNQQTQKGVAHKGTVQFFDAFPLTAPEIVPDIMNPHYGPYYREGKPPGDYHQPIPIFFLTIAKNTSFQFIFGAKHFDLSQPLWDLNISGDKKKRNLLTWVMNALENHGFGAKTAVGYGYME